MPDEDKNFRGSFVLDFGIWWRQVETIYSLINALKLLLGELSLKIST